MRRKCVDVLGLNWSASTYWVTVQNCRCYTFFCHSFRIYLMILLNERWIGILSVVRIIENKIIFASHWYIGKPTKQSHALPKDDQCSDRPSSKFTARKTAYYHSSTIILKFSQWHILDSLVLAGLETFLNTLHHSSTILFQFQSCISNFLFTRNIFVGYRFKFYKDFCNIHISTFFKNK